MAASRTDRIAMSAKPSWLKHTSLLKINLHLTAKIVLTLLLKYKWAEKYLLARSLREVAMARGLSFAVFSAFFIFAGGFTEAQGTSLKIHPFVQKANHSVLSLYTD